jgi:hypothetical protein
VKGLIAYDNCRDALEKAHMEIDIKDEISNTYKDENRVLIGDNAILTKDNKHLKSSIILWKVFGVSGAIVGFYMGTKI